MWYTFDVVWIPLKTYTLLKGTNWELSVLNTAVERLLRSLLVWQLTSGTTERLPLRWGQPRYEPGVPPCCWFPCSVYTMSSHLASSTSYNFLEACLLHVPFYFILGKHGRLCLCKICGNLEPSFSTATSDLDADELLGILVKLILSLSGITPVPAPKYLCCSKCKIPMDIFWSKRARAVLKEEIVWRFRSDFERLNNLFIPFFRVRFFPLIKDFIWFENNQQYSDIISTEPYEYRPRLSL